MITANEKWRLDNGPLINKLNKKKRRENKFYVRLSNGQILKLKALNKDDALKEAETRFGNYDNKCRYMDKYIVFQYKK
ncbi:hypothetical protein HH007_13155 [Treponema denticola]|uniref:hypothetical protein n=1 Tax=Treponema denticola TaxID=158 RepID=UPI003D6F1D3C